MKIVLKIRLLAFLLLSGILLSACNDAIYDDEGDCTVQYLVRFKYDYNMKFADAFAGEVEAVTLHLIDGNGKVIWQKTESGEALASDGYAMEVDVAPGTYSMLAWCSSANPTTFDARNDGVCESLKVDFRTERDADGKEYIGKKLDRLYHGYVADVAFPAAESGTFVHTIHLTKDTNHFVVTLQQLSGEALDKDAVEFEITDDNAHLDWDNMPVAGTPVTYRQWYKTAVSADLSAKSRVDNNTFSGVVAELTTSRLMKNSNARLRVYRTDNGETIASIRLIDAIMLVKGYEVSKRLTDQQYLDYKDEYDMTFFLDQNHKWVDCLIQIQSWRVVYQEQPLVGDEDQVNG